MSPKDRLVNFSKWNKIWLDWDNWLLKNKISPLEACVNFVFSQKNVDKIVIGINSSNELGEILDIIIKNKKNLLFPPGCRDKNLIKPSNWKI